MSIEENVKARDVAKESLAYVLAFGRESKLSPAGLRRYFENVSKALLEIIREQAPEEEASQPAGPMSDEEAREFGREKIAFGKFKGKRLDEVPISYLRWLDEQPNFRMDLRRYLASERVLREEEEGGDDYA